MSAVAYLGLPVDVEPNGAFYAYFDVSSTGLSATTFCERALREAHVALTPGADFGEATADTHVRLSYCFLMLPSSLRWSMSRTVVFELASGSGRAPAAAATARTARPARDRDRRPA